ncbi:MAG: ribokinase [Ignavibacteria bacterium]|nr:ribokinase [Ignavibacteria bacterium]
MSQRITVIGSSNTDMIVKTKHLPKPGETVLGGNFFMASGGKGANQAVASARAGGDVIFICKVGNDIFGKNAVENFKSDNINTDYVFIDNDSPSGIALIFVSENGENSIAVALGANEKLSIEDIQSKEKVIANSAILLLQLETPIPTVNEAIEIAFKNKIPVVLNPAPAQRLDDELLRKISIITPNETETEILTNRRMQTDEDIVASAKILREKGIETVLITLGSKGVYVDSDEMKGFIPAFKVDAVDTTAAGDVFNGALVTALAEGKSLQASIKFASAASAISVTKIGAQSSIPYREQIEEFLEIRK